MSRKTLLLIIYVLISFCVLILYPLGDPVPGGTKYHLPEPRDVDINGITFKISWGFLEDENSTGACHAEKLLNRSVVKGERTFHQNDILLLDIIVYDFGEDVDISLFNDGTYVEKSINGVDGIFKNESTTTSSGFVKNTHPRYFFNYSKDGKVIMIQCDKLEMIGDIVT